MTWIIDTIQLATNDLLHENVIDFKCHLAFIACYTQRHSWPHDTLSISTLHVETDNSRVDMLMSTRSTLERSNEERNKESFRKTASCELLTRINLALAFFFFLSDLAFSFSAFFFMSSISENVEERTLPLVSTTRFCFEAWATPVDVELVTPRAICPLHWERRFSTNKTLNYLEFDEMVTSFHMIGCLPALKK